MSVTDNRTAIDKVLKAKNLDTLRVAIGKDWQPKFNLPDSLPATVVVAEGRVRIVHDSVLLDPVAQLEADLAAVKNPATSQLAAPSAQ